MAVELRNLGWVKRLLSEGANPNVMIDGDTLLQFSLLTLDDEIANLLVEAGATGPRECEVVYRNGDRTAWVLRVCPGSYCFPTELSGHEADGGQEEEGPAFSAFALPILG